MHQEKDQLHPRSKHRERYDFAQLVKACPELEKYLLKAAASDYTIDFTDPESVKTLNKALLKLFYGISLWDIPDGYLCPPVPGRADYIHYMADLLAESNEKIPRGKSVRVLDIGVGANCIYPIVGYSEYGWTFIGSEIDPYSIRSAKNIIEANSLNKSISIRRQVSSDNILEGVINHGEKFDLTICNPPFHASMKEASEGTARKWKNLGYSKQTGADLNFGGKNGELWCEGGELNFLLRMIRESKGYKGSVLWFSSLISKKETLPACYSELKKVNAVEVLTINMTQGQKQSRVLAWTFIEPENRNKWRELHLPS
ncbi:MAG: 23S rRNA (adenine(1618)-N(6))-methyltransferase RlmF [Daejeonella sp.]